MNAILVIPTYCERENIGPLLTRIQALKIRGLHTLVVDDHSSDGTSAEVQRWVEKTKNTDSCVYLLERKNQRGRGTAGITGIAHALQLGAEWILEMDADLSHPPEILPKMLEMGSRFDIVIGSRLHEKSRDHRSYFRRLITKLANRYTRFWLQCPRHTSQVQDWTSGFRLYKREVFERIPPESLVSTGPSILQEVLFRALNQGLTATEIDFVMLDRAFGKSTFTRKVALESLRRIPCYRLLFSQEIRGNTPFILSRLSTKCLSTNYWEVTVKTQIPFDQIPFAQQPHEKTPSKSKAS